MSCSQVSEAEDEQVPLPCFTHDGINYLYLKHSNLYCTYHITDHPPILIPVMLIRHGILVLALSRKNTNAASIMLYLHKLTQVFSEYFKELEEESIRDNFVIVYELLDEMMDFGYPQTTETKILQE